MTIPVSPDLPRRGRFRAWLRRVFRRPTAAPPIHHDHNQPVSEYRTGEPITVPADGGVFEFTVHYDMTWSARGMSRNHLKHWIDVYHESAIRALRQEIWPIGRNHLPQEPHAAEEAMNDALRQGWCFGDPRETVSCLATVRVVADQRVLSRHQPLWEQLVELDLRYRLEHRRIDHVVDLLTRWRGLLAEFGDDPIVIQAATLTDDDVATALEGLATRRLALGADLVNVLEKARSAHGQFGLFELAKAYDVAVRTFERQAGLRTGTVSVNAVDSP
jgi:hypothetical protein